MAPVVPPAITCAENVSLLHLLHYVVEPPSSRPMDDILDLHGNYSLSLAKERGLVDTLAFLSSVKHNPNHITAICVRENLKSSSLDVLLAMNKVSCKDGDEFLRKLKLDFEKLFTELSRVRGGDAASNEDSIFAVLISMCQARILCRLGFIGNTWKRKPKKQVKDSLQQAVNSLKKLDQKKHGNLISVARIFEERAKLVIKLVDSWVQYQKLAPLAELVKGMHHLSQADKLQPLFNTIPNELMESNLRISLLNMINKVSRYREAARFLYRTAKKFQLARKMKIVLVNLPEKVFQKADTSQYKPTLLSAVSRISGSGGQRKLNHICRVLNIKEQEANSQFTQQTKKTLKEGKVHAEIQLLCYLETERFKQPPRVICSSKDACFLCNAFILMYGKIHMPGCHGRLYPGWRLPLFPKGSNLEQRFLGVLEQQFRKSLDLMLLRQRKTVYPEPNESTVLTLPVSVSTVGSFILPDDTTKQPEDTDTVIVQKKIDDDIKEETRTIIKEEIDVSEEEKSIQPRRTSIMTAQNNHLVYDPKVRWSESNIPKMQTDAALEMKKESIHTTFGSISLAIPSSQDLPPTCVVDPNSSLIQGHMISNSIEIGCRSQFYTTGPLELQIEYSAESRTVMSKSNPRKLAYSIKWLTMNAAEKLKATSVIDGGLLEGESTHTADDLNCLYISGGGSVMQIQFH